MCVNACVCMSFTVGRGVCVCVMPCEIVMDRLTSKNHRPVLY